MGRISVSSDWEATSEAVVEEDEQEEGYAMGENWDGVLTVREGSRSLGGCLGQREATDIVREWREEEGGGGDELDV